MIGADALERWLSGGPIGRSPDTRAAAPPSRSPRAARTSAERGCTRPPVYDALLAELEREQSSHVVGAVAPADEGT